MQKEIAVLLSHVEKPARYAGGEYGAVIKDLEAVKTRFAFCFPDVYEVGMSHLGMRILYGLLNSLESVWCERVFSPWIDMEERMRKAKLPLYALESCSPLSDFDIIGFTLQYELSYSTVLNMLDLGGVPLFAKDRPGLKNLVIAGGPCTMNCEPLADFIDLAVIGEAEEVLPQLVALYERCRHASASKTEFLTLAAGLQGVYVPSFYDVSYHADGRVAAIVPNCDAAPARVKKCIIADLDSVYFPETAVVPSMEIVHNRTMLEVFRGCIRGCRFCAAGYTTRPVRRKSPETLIRQGKALAAHSGLSEIALSSLSTSDYPELSSLCDGLIEYCEEKRISLSLPSLRADNFSVELMEKVQKVRKSGLTFAPEAGSQRLRDAINKNIREEDLLQACALAFSGGWNGVKLYFMLGLPSENTADVEEIAVLARKVFRVWQNHSKNKARGCKITVSTSSFVPKPHTPFQWAAQDTPEMLSSKIAILKEQFRGKHIQYRWHEPQTSLLEAIFARGDRRLGAVIFAAWKAGCRLDGWDDCCRFDLWTLAMAEVGLSPEFYTSRERTEDEVFPWDVIDCGVSKDFLLSQYNRTFEGVLTPDCREGCANCGVLESFGGFCHA